MKYSSQLYYNLLHLTGCDSEKDGECGDADATEKYKLFPDEITDRNAAGHGKFRLTIYNPVASTGKNFDQPLPGRGGGGGGEVDHSCPRCPVLLNL